MSLFLILIAMAPSNMASLSVELKLKSRPNLYQTQQPLIRRAVGNIYFADNASLYVLGDDGEQLNQNNLKQTMDKTFPDQPGKGWYIMDYTIVPARGFICVSLVNQDAGVEYKMVFLDLEAREILGFGEDPTLPDPTQAGFRQLFVLSDGGLIANVSKRDISYRKQSLKLREVDIFPVGDVFKIEYFAHVESRFFEVDSAQHDDTKVVLNQLPDGRVFFAYSQTPKITFYHRNDADYFEKQGFISLDLPLGDGQKVSKVLAIVGDENEGFKIAYLTSGKQRRLQITEVNAWGKKAPGMETRTFNDRLFVEFDTEGVWLYRTEDNRHYLSLEKW
jgi:hypothetical protein